MRHLITSEFQQNVLLRRTEYSTVYTPAPHVWLQAVSYRGLVASVH